MTLNTIIISDNLICLELLNELCAECSKINVIGKFTTFAETEALLKKQSADYILIDTPLDNNTALSYAKSIRSLSTDSFLVYLVSTPEQCYNAMMIKSDYCIIKPFEARDIQNTAQKAAAIKHTFHYSTEISMFGQFRVFYDGEPVEFISSKAKELFALCVDHCGADVSLEEAADKLWSDRPYDSKVKALYRKAVMNTRRTMEKYKIENVFSSYRGSCRINPNNIKCDYYLYKFAPDENIALCNEEYLPDYPWAQAKAAALHFQRESFSKII